MVSSFNKSIWISLFFSRILQSSNCFITTTISYNSNSKFNSKFNSNSNLNLLSNGQNNDISVHNRRYMTGQNTRNYSKMMNRSIKKQENYSLLQWNSQTQTQTQTQTQRFKTKLGSGSESTSTSTSTSFSMDDETCELGLNVVDNCVTIKGTESKLSAATNLAKCICGAGSFALPHVFLDEGIIGGSIALLTCGFLATYTMQLISDMKIETNTRSYVDLAQLTLGKQAANLVFALTLSASLGVCSSYVVFMGQTLESLSCDVTSTNIIRQLFPDVSIVSWEILISTLLFPLTLLRSYAVFAFTSGLGVVAVLGGILVTLASGIFVEPGGGLMYALHSVTEQAMFPSSFGAAFGNSFGTVAFLFCINFLTFPIMNSMKEPREYNDAIQYAVLGTASFNILFAVLCVGFYGEDTADLVLANLGNGPYLSALKILLCIDLLFTYPIVFSSGRQIMENALIGDVDVDDIDDMDMDMDKTKRNNLSLKRAGIAGGGVLTCFSLAQIGGFGTIANLVGGVAQGTLAFVLPPLIAVTIVRSNKKKGIKIGMGAYDGIEFDLDKNNRGGEVAQLILGLFGVFVVILTSYFTVVTIVSDII